MLLRRSNVVRSWRGLERRILNLNLPSDGFYIGWAFGFACIRLTSLDDPMLCWPSTARWYLCTGAIGTAMKAAKPRQRRTLDGNSGRTSFLRIACETSGIRAPCAGKDGTSTSYGSATPRGGTFSGFRRGFGGRKDRGRKETTVTPPDSASPGMAAAFLRVPIRGVRRLK
jgi:hypothetical protein